MPVGPHWSGHFGEEKIIFLLPDFEPRITYRYIILELSFIHQRKNVCSINVHKKEGIRLKRGYKTLCTAILSLNNILLQSFSSNISLNTTHITFRRIARGGGSFAWRLFSIEFKLFGISAPKFPDTFHGRLLYSYIHTNNANIFIYSYE